MSIQKYKTKLVSKESISDVVFKYILERPKDFTFAPGQYINIPVSKNTRRSYSIASSISAETVDLIIDTFPNGLGSNFFKNLQLGKEFEFLGPLGHMYIQNSDLTFGGINFISTGTGIAPFLSIFDYLDQNKYKGKVFNLYSEKFKKDLIQKYDYKYLKLSSIITLTRDSDSCYLNGRVSSYFDKLSIDSNSLYFVCGNSKMVEDACKYLSTNGISKDQIRREVYY